MKSKIIPGIILVIGIFALILATNSTITGLSIIDNPTLDYALTHTNELQTRFNSHITEVPKSVKFLLGDEKILLEIKRLDDTIKKLSIITKEGTILDISNLVIEDYTMNVYVKEETINNILNSNNQVTAAMDALNRKEIEITTNNFWKKMKLTFSKLGVKTYSWFKK